MRRWDEHSNYRLCHCCMALVKSAKNVSETVVESTCNLISALEFHHGCLHIWHQPHTHRHTYSALHQARRDSLDGIVPFTHPVQNIEPQNVCVSVHCPFKYGQKSFITDVFFRNAFSSVDSLKPHVYKVVNYHYRCHRWAEHLFWMVVT